MQTIITGKKVKHSSYKLDSKRLSDVLIVHKRLRGQISIRLLSEHRTSVCCPKLFAVLCGETENVEFTLPLVWQVVVFYVY